MAKLRKIVPAILTEDSKALETMIRQAENFASYVQFDIMDGKFVPSWSITCQDLMTVEIKFSWEAHLMVEQPENHLDDFNKAGAKKVVFHYESTSSPQSVISQARGLGLEVGLAINPETKVTTILPFVNEVDSILLLTVHPGFYGSKFIPEVLDKVIELRQYWPAIEVGADGGINEGNIVKVTRSGIDVLCVGSAIFLQPNPAENYANLIALIEKALSPDESR